MPNGGLRAGQLPDRQLTDSSDRAVDSRVVLIRTEDAMIQLHHLHGSPVPASDLRGQVLPEDRHLFAIRRANMRRKVSLNTVFTAVRSKQEQVGKLACG